jgi:tartrate dehydratase beta subunit/fumarate hydratase class I family protein
MSAANSFAAVDLPGSCVYHSGNLSTTRHTGNMAPKTARRVALIYFAIFFALVSVSLAILALQISKNVIEILVHIAELVDPYKN